MNGSFDFSDENYAVCETDGFRCVGKEINIEERAAYGKPCMPSYGKDVISLVSMDGTINEGSLHDTCILSRLSVPVLPS
jgi:hypothetical protein